VETLGFNSTAGFVIIPTPIRLTLSELESSRSLPMQLSLTTTLPRHPRAAVMRPLVPLSREAAMSQLDQIAAASGQRVVRQDGLGALSALLAALGGLVLVGAAAMWRGPVDTPPVALPAAAAVVAPAVVAAPPPVPAPVVAAEAPVLAALPAVEPPASVVDAEPAVAVPAEPSADELAQKARARQLADARRKAAAQALERMAAAEALRLQAAAQRRDAELLAQQADEQRRQRAAAEAATRQAQVATVAMAPRRSVRDTCNGRGLFAESACLARECARGDHQADPVCVRLRETDESQRRASIDR
jgi:hypothetical protein